MRTTRVVDNTPIGREAAVAQPSSLAPLTAPPATAALYQFEPMLRRYFARRIRRDEVDDMVQEVFLRMQSQLPAIDHIDRYLFRVASNVLTDRLRHAASRKETLHEHMQEVHHPVDDRSPEKLALTRETLDRVAEAIGRLPEKTRDIFVLHRFKDMTCADIAALMGISASAIEKHIFKALVVLNDEVGAV
jgi:RNA polymerase sigma-70 factor (ECF subfamily)